MEEYLQIIRTLVILKDVYNRQMILVDEGYAEWKRLNKVSEKINEILLRILDIILKGVK